MNAGLIGKKTRFFTFCVGICCSLMAQQDDTMIFEKDPQDAPAPPTLEEIISSYEGNLISRPLQHVGNFKSIIVDFTVDGYEGQHMALKGPVISLKGSVPHEWQQDTGLSSRYGIALRNRYVTDVTMGFSVLRGSNFIASTNTEDVISFLAGLKNIYRDRLQLNDMPADFRDNGFMAHLLGHETVYLDYSIASRNDESVPVRHYSYYVKVDQNWVEITLFGPEDKLPSFVDPFKRFLRNLSIVQNKEEAFGKTE